MHSFDCRAPGGEVGGQVFSCPGSKGATILSIALHPEDPWLYASTDTGHVVAWDLRYPDQLLEPNLPAEQAHSEVELRAHVGPLHALAVTAKGSRGLHSLLSAGDDGHVVCRSMARQGSSSSRRGLGGGESGLFAGFSGATGAGSSSSSSAVAPVERASAFSAEGTQSVLHADTPLNGVAFLCSEKQAQRGRGEGFVVATSQLGSLEYAQLQGHI